MPGMRQDTLIVDARITALPKTLSDPIPEVIVETEEGEEIVLFAYYPDEIAFRAEEFVGKTLAEARELKVRRDTEFLQS